MFVAMAQNSHQKHIAILVVLISHDPFLYFSHLLQNPGIFYNFLITRYNYTITTFLANTLA